MTPNMNSYTKETFQVSVSHICSQVIFADASCPLSFHFCLHKLSGS